MEALKINGKNISHNDEFGFLYKKTSIRPSVISAIATIPDYMEALRAFTGTLDDQSVYEIIKATYTNILAEGRSNRASRSVMKRISKDVKGDSLAWQKD